MKWRRGFEATAVMLFLLPATIAFGAEVGVIGDMHILETITGLSYPLKLDNQDASSGSTTGIIFSTGGSGAERGKGALVYETTGTWNRGRFHFLQEPSPNMLNPTITNAVLTIRNDGNVGIGNTEPGVKLDVTGWIRAKTGYGDSISIGGDSAGGDVEIQISAPAERNKISLWNSQLQSGVDLGVRTISAENLNITGSITTTPKTGRLSIPPYAFQLGSGCKIHQLDYQLNSLYIYHEGLLQDCWANAAVTLPEGATINKFTSFWYVNFDEPSSTYASLWRTDYGAYGTEFEMATTGPIMGRQNAMRVISDTTINQPLVDNENFGYYVRINILYDFSQQDAQFFGAVIEYTYTSP